MDLNPLRLTVQPARPGLERAARRSAGDGRRPPLRLGATAAYHWTLRSWGIAR